MAPGIGNQDNRQEGRANQTKKIIANVDVHVFRQYKGHYVALKDYQVIKDMLTVAIKELERVRNTGMPNSPAVIAARHTLELIWS